MMIKAQQSPAAEYNVKLKRKEISANILRSTNR